MTQSEDLFSRAQKVIPGGVNSPVRAFKGVGGTPLFIKRAELAYLYDADDNRYIDYIGSWGPMIAGHANPEILDAVREAVKDFLPIDLSAVKQDEIDIFPFEKKKPIAAKMAVVITSVVNVTV